MTALMQIPSTSSTQAQDLVTVFWLIIGVVVAFIIVVLLYKWWNADPTERVDTRKYPSWLKPSGSAETERLPTVIMDPGDVTSVRPVHPESMTGVVRHYSTEAESIRERPTYWGGFTEMLDNETGEKIGRYEPRFQ